MIVLDTNVVSEMMKPAPEPRVEEWLARQLPFDVFTTSITQAEIFYGIELLAKGKRQDHLLRLAEELFEEDFAGRLLPFGSAAARMYPAIIVGRMKLGRPISLLDAQIAAIAAAHGATLATRNVSDFKDCGVRVVNPWAA